MQISELVSYSVPIRVSADFGARHNHNINLCGTESECANRLWVIERLSFDNPQMRFHTY